MEKEVPAGDQSKERQEAKNPMQDSYEAHLDFSFLQFLYKKDKAASTPLPLYLQM